MDYEHKIFCKHVAQAVDGNGVETTEPHVLEILMYTNVKAGADLTTCQTYFGVPTESVTAYWVSKTGNDGTGDGTKAKPYLTIEACYKAKAAGSEIYVKSGIFTEQYSGGSQYFYADKSITVTGIGLTEIRTVNTNYVILIVNNSPVFKRIIINGVTNHTDCVNFYASNSLTAKFYNCKFVGASTGYNIRTASSAATQVCELYDCVLPEFDPILIYDAGSVIQGCCLNCTVQFVTGGTYNYNKHTYLTYSATPVVKNAITAKYNKITTKSNGIYNDIAIDSDIQYNNIEFVWTADTGLNMTVVYCDTLNKIPTVKNNKIVCTSLLISRSVTFIELTNNVVTPEVSNNILLSSSLSSVYHIKVSDGTHVVGKCKINGNYSHSNTCGAGIVITIGGESVNSNIFNESEVIGNTLIGVLKDNPDADPNDNHKALFSGGIDFDIRNNRFEHCGIALVVKTGLNPASYTKNGIGYNVFVNNYIDMWIRGITALTIYGNSLNRNSGFSGTASHSRIVVDANTGTKYSENVLIKNTIIQNNDTDISNALVLFDAHAAGNGCKLFNCILSQKNVTGNLLNNGTANYTDLTTLHNDGLADDCLLTDPLFTSALILTVSALSPALGAGVTLDAAYDDGLDASTNWGNASTVPAVVTKQQGAAWDIGAYVH